MELYQLTFNKANIYDTLFFSIKSASEFKSVFDFKEEKPELFEEWKIICKAKYSTDSDNMPSDAYMQVLNDLYKSKAVFYPEFSRIIGITYATIKIENNKMNRKLKKIVDKDEFTIIKSFHSVLNQISLEGIQSKPQYFPTLCGHNIINNDIPLFIKRLILYRDRFENSSDLIPYILKNHLIAKPWDSNTLDTLNVWKFNGVSNTPLRTLINYLNLKKTVDLMEMDELSQYYWNNISSNEEETLKNISIQSANQTNLTIQIINELRSL